MLRLISNLNNGYIEGQIVQIASQDPKDTGYIFQGKNKIYTKIQ